MTTQKKPSNYNTKEPKIKKQPTINNGSGGGSDNSSNNISSNTSISSRSNSGSSSGNSTNMVKGQGPPAMATEGYTSKNLK